MPDSTIEPVRYAPRALETVAARILSAVGASEEEASVVARYLTMSDLAGHPSHGVLRVKQYTEQVLKNEIVCRQEPRIVNEGPGFAMLDGRLGFGQIGAEHATALACDKARSQGIGMVALRNSAHVGRLSDWVELAADQGCISMHFVNTMSTPKIAPWGSIDRRLSTNPLAWGMPLKDRDPIVVDLTTSVVAEGKVRLAHTAGKSIPNGWVLDKTGKPSNDPGALYEGGTLMPLGGFDAGHKGYALSLMVELMSGALSGGGAGGPDRKVNCNNFTIIAIDPSRIARENSIADEALRFAEWIKSSTPTDPDQPVLLPGELERTTRARHMRDGLPVERSVIDTLRDTAIKVDLPAGMVDEIFNSSIHQ